MSQAMVDELGVKGVQEMNNETMWYNGCYTMTSYVQGNEKVFTKNPTYWDTASMVISWASKKRKRLRTRLPTSYTPTSLPS